MQSLNFRSNRNQVRLDKLEPVLMFLTISRKRVELNRRNMKNLNFRLGADKNLIPPVLRKLTLASTTSFFEFELAHNFTGILHH